MLYYLHLLADKWSVLRVFQYITVRAFAGAGTAFVLSLILGPVVIRRLGRLCSGDATRYSEDVPVLDKLHGAQKKTTPTMGGVLIIVSVGVAVLLWAIPNNPLIWLVLTTMLAFGAIGFADDFIKVVRRRPGGMSARWKLLLQALWVAVVFAIMLSLPMTREHARQLMVPFCKAPVLSDMGLIAAFVFVALVMIGASNAVNLTDGLDGLAIGCTGSVALAYLVLAYVAGHIQFANYLQVPYIAGSGELAVFCGCLLGGALGFLWFNCHPAQVFMGDTGSLALGGGLGMVAVLIKHELALLVIGGVFVMEAVSVILQVGWFKWTRRRIFACAPLHHHFELKKNQPWSETQVTIRFWIISIICALCGVLMLKIR
ncbi:MAG: phospho-N-acetylmuramoyl-pentapeptide-transferase [Kiritimatiellia bacterium]|jgi:phospho-N-acetylmuramoyl-pentapeptide-transferase